MFNHSNDPAMVHYFENDTIVIKAIRDVDPGQELCISYVELLASQHDIRNQLISKYFFDIGDAIIKDAHLGSNDALRIEYELDRSDGSAAAQGKDDVVCLPRPNIAHATLAISWAPCIDVPIAIDSGKGACQTRSSGAGSPSLCCCNPNCNVNILSLEPLPPLGPLYKQAFVCAKAAGKESIAQHYKNRYEDIQRVVLGMDV